MNTNTTATKTAQLDMNETVSAQESDWIKACLDAAEKDEVYRIFRSTDALIRVIEGTPRVGGIWNLRRLLKNPLFLHALPNIQTSDTIGLPLNMIDFQAPIDIDNGDSIQYSLTPITIRYANNAANCISLFGQDVLKDAERIQEIGSGYGGECKIFNDFAVSLMGTPIGKKWHVFDLASSQGIIKRFLHDFKYECTFNSLADYVHPEGSDSLVISNGAFSEMRGELLTAYFDAVIVPAKRGYFITNFDSHSAPYGGWSTKEFIQRLRDSGKEDVVVLPTAEYLSHFDLQAGSKLIVFGHTTQAIRRSSVSNADIVRIRLLSVLLNTVVAIQKSFINSSR